MTPSKVEELIYERDESRRAMFAAQEALGEYHRAFEEFLPRSPTAGSLSNLTEDLGSDGIQGILTFQSPVIRFRLSPLAASLAKSDTILNYTRSAAKRFADEVVAAVLAAARK